LIFYSASVSQFATTIIFNLSVINSISKFSGLKTGSRRNHHDVLSFITIRKLTIYNWPFTNSQIRTFSNSLIFTTSDFLWTTDML